MIARGMVHGRFQPFHNGHLEYLNGAAVRCEEIFVGITNPDPARVLPEESDPLRHLPESNPCSVRRADADGQGRSCRCGHRARAPARRPVSRQRARAVAGVRPRRRRPVHPPLLGLGRDEARSPARGRLRGRRARRGQPTKEISGADVRAALRETAATGRASCRPGSPPCCAKCSGPLCKRAVSPRTFRLGVRFSGKDTTRRHTSGGSGSCARSLSPRSPPPRWWSPGASQPASTAVTKTVEITSTAF